MASALCESFVNSDIDPQHKARNYTQFKYNSNTFFRTTDLLLFCFHFRFFVFRFVGGYLELIRKFIE